MGYSPWVPKESALTELMSRMQGIKIPHATKSACVLSHVGFSVTLWTVAHQAPLSMGFFRQEYWSGLPFHF